MNRSCNIISRDNSLANEIKISGYLTCIGDRHKTDPQGKFNLVPCSTSQLKVVSKLKSLKVEKRMKDDDLKLLRSFDDKRTFVNVEPFLALQAKEP